MDGVVARVTFCAFEINLFYIFIKESFFNAADGCCNREHNYTDLKNVQCEMSESRRKRSTLREPISLNNATDDFLYFITTHKTFFKQSRQIFTEFSFNSSHFFFVF